MVEVLLIGQDHAGNISMIETHQLATSLLNDDALKVSFEYDLDTVPTIFLTDSVGNALTQFIGFGKQDWIDLIQKLSDITGIPVPAIQWDSYPESHPGCGSRSVEPGIAERLEAESSGSPLRARQIDIATHDDVHEFLYEQGLTDGLPVIPPTPERVIRILEGTKRDPQETVAVVPPNLAPVTVEKIAINSVMAGCKPEYLPVVIAAVEAVCTEEFNAHGVGATTMGATPVLIVN